MPKVYKKTLIFAHIPKCAGMSLRKALASNFPETAVHTIVSWSTQDALDSVSALRSKMASGAPISLIMGHVEYGFHKCLGISDEDVTYVSVMREPISRIVSLFRYLRSEKLRHDHDEAKSMSFSEFIRTEKMLPLISNAQAKHLLAVQPTPAPQEAVASLRQLISDNRLVVGTVEQYDKTLAIMQFFLGLTLQHERINQSPGTIEAVSEPDRAFLERINQVDLALWKSVEAMLEWMPRSSKY